MYRLCRIRSSITRSGGIIFYLLFCSIIKSKKKNESERERNTKVGLEVGGVGATLESGVSDRNTTEEKDEFAVARGRHKIAPAGEVSLSIK